MMKRAMIYVHGKNGSFREIEQYKKNCDGLDLIGVDYNEYLPWVVQDQIQSIYEEVEHKYDGIFLLANSIGAYFSMLALQNRKIERALFISPILDMEQLILDMMDWANVSEKELYEKGEIATNFGETLSWKYLCFVRDNPIVWKTPTKILYGSHDDLTSRQTIDKFVHAHNASLTVLESGEHWFHTDEQLAYLDKWMKDAVK